MVITESASILQRSFEDLWFAVVSFVPSILLAVIIFVIGWIIGSILSRVIAQIVDMLRVDEALKSAGVDRAVRDAGFSLNLGRFLGELVKWFIIAVFLVAALDVLGLNRVNIFLQQVVLLYIPQVIVAVLILVLGAVIAELSKNIIGGSARAAGAPSANLAGSVAKWAIWVVAVLAALNQLNVASAFVQTLFTGLVVALSLAFGLAFGLGGKEAAARYIEKTRSEIGDRS